MAELLLQQTDAPKAVPVYEKLIAKYPTVEQLARAHLHTIQLLLSPLGLDYRAPRLRMAAKLVVRKYGGEVPSDESELLQMTGIGRYMARSVCAVAYGQRKGILDTNVIRIVERFFGVESRRKRPREDLGLWRLVDALVPNDGRVDVAQWNWSLLDFGAIICTVRNPRHDECPLRHWCSDASRSDGPANSIQH